MKSKLGIVFKMETAQCVVVAEAQKPVSYCFLTCLTCSTIHKSKMLYTVFTNLIPLSGHFQMKVSSSCFMLFENI